MHTSEEPLRRAKPLLVGLAVAVWSIAAGQPASAEWFADLYLGAAFTQTQDVKITTPSLTLPPPAGTIILAAPIPERFSGVDFDTSPSYGGRIGYWLEPLPQLGFALDVFRFHPDVSPQTRNVTIFGGPVLGTTTMPFRLADIDIDVTGIAFDLMLRWPLPTGSGFPKGRLQPYLTVGPTLFIVDVDDTTNFGPPSRQSDTDTEVGVKVGAGLAWQVHRNVALFGEYRFTHVNAKVKFRDPGGTETAEADLDTHHVIFGVSFRY